MDRITFIVLGLVLFTLWLCSAIPGNYRKARSTGLPVYITFTNSSAPAWIVIISVLGYQGLEKCLPKAIFDRVKFTIAGWEFHNRYQVAATRGKTWMAVTTGGNILMVSDPQLAHAILGRRKHLVRPAIANKILSKFGPNVFSEDNENWQRHRRLVAPMLNERIMAAVWNESKQQAKQMMESFRGLNETNQTPAGLETITMNVIAAAAFGKNTAFADSKEEAPPGFQMSFYKGIGLVIHRFFLALAMPVSVLTSFVMPQSFRELGTAVAEFPRHARGIIAEEIEQESDTTRNSLVSAMVKVADQSNGAKSGSNYLLEDEIVGNLFAFMLAGFDTTANTLTYAVLLLTIHPEWQDWIIAGIDEADKQSPTSSYDPTWSMLPRVRALMFETMRICTPISHVARIASEDIIVNDTLIPRDTTVQVAAAVLHVLPDYWGPDSLEFKPSRWCIGPHPDGVAACETLLDPPQGNYMPWSTGPRNCPGMKMSEVEFVGVMYEIFRSYKVEPILENGEDLKMARERLNGLLLDSTPGLSLQMRHPERVGLKWLPRAKVDKA